MKPQQILALDPAASTGFAHSNGQRGVIRIDAKGTDLRLWFFHDWLTETIKAWGCDMLAYEDASFGSVNPNVQAMHNELRAIIKLVACEFTIPTKGFHPTTIKLFATGSGRAKKPAMIAAAKRMLGIETTRDDEADAIWILELAKRPDCWPKPAKASPTRRRGRAKEPRLF